MQSAYMHDESSIVEFHVSSIILTKLHYVSVMNLHTLMRRAPNDLIMHIGVGVYAFIQ